MSAEAKAAALRHVRAATRNSRLSRERRDAAIQLAASAASYSEIAEAAGLSKARVAKIVTAQRDAAEL